MLLSLRALAVAADGLYAQGLASITETPSALTVAGLSAADVQAMGQNLTVLGWQFQVVDSAGENADPSALTDDYAPFIVTADKPAVAGALPVVTLAGMCALLTAEQPDSVWHVATLATPFASMATDFRPWGGTGLFSPAMPTKSPRELVRENNVPPKAPSDVRRWILRGPANAEQWADASFRAFADLSAQALMRALAGEIRTDGGLLFKGPPHTQLEPPKGDVVADLGLKGYNDIRDAAAWVYENGVEAERRHGLFIAEFGATNPSTSVAARAFALVAADVVQGAKLAYQLSLSDLTREAIKAQGDLRKAVADDTAKLADNTRQVATAVAAALATCVGLVAAKAGTTTPHWVIQLIALVAAIYVGVVIASGWIFMKLQDDMRRKWRTRLYRFVPSSDYKVMVLEPASRAQLMFRVAAISGIIISVLAVSIVFAASY